MEDVVKAYKCRYPEERISILRLELDYELAILHEAMLEECAQKMEESKERLREIRHEMIVLEAL
jgi:DNA polymerase III delta prime subunit